MGWNRTSLFIRHIHVAPLVEHRHVKFSFKHFRTSAQLVLALIVDILFWQHQHTNALLFAIFKQFKLVRRRT